MQYLLTDMSKATAKVEVAENYEIEEELLIPDQHGSSKGTNESYRIVSF